MVNVTAADGLETQEPVQQQPWYWHTLPGINLYIIGQHSGIWVTNEMLPNCDHEGLVNDMSTMAQIVSRH